MNNQSLFRQLGCFELSREFLEEFPEHAYNILTSVAIIETKWEIYSNTIIYYAFGYSFDYVPIGQIMPNYRPVLDIISNKISWEKIDE